MKKLYNIIGFPVYLYDSFGRKLVNDIENAWVCFFVILLYSCVCIFSIPLVAQYVFHKDIFMLWIIIGYGMMVAYEKSEYYEQTRNKNK